MSRNAQGSRYQPQPAPDDNRPALTAEPELDRRKIRRGGAQRDISNPIVMPSGYYGFLSRMDGSAEGPWHCVFECTDRFWFNLNLETSMPNNYNGTRLRAVLNGFPYEAVWANSIGQRIIFRNIYEAYQEMVTDSSNPAPLALYEIELYGEDLESRFRLHDPSGGNGPVLQPGYWYGLEVVQGPSPEPSLETGILRKENPQTNELGDPASYLIKSLENLPLVPDPTNFTWRSQAELRATHHTRGL